MKALPYIKKDENGFFTFYVEDKPYYIFGGEIHNSSASNTAYMKARVWPAVRNLNLNTVIAPVYWECVEPQEGNFEFTLVDDLIYEARRENLKLELLWFGSWKNTSMDYAPEWVKQDAKRFFHAHNAPGCPVEILSPLCEALVEADACAYTRLMEHIKVVDEQEQTVIFMQVENEIGMFGAERDFSPEACQKYQEQIPEEMRIFAKTTGNWYEVFGEEAPELFMTYYYAKAIEQIAAAGKEVYALPCGVNAWLEQFPYRPGTYPCGGPIAKYMPVWKKIAPSVDVMSPDIYLPDFRGVCDAYAAEDNALFIPEARRDAISASNVFYAFGQYHAIGFSPFGIEDFSENDFIGEAEHGALSEETLKALSIDRDAYSCKATGKYLKESYRILSNMTGLLLTYRGQGRVHAFIQGNEQETGTIVSLEKADLMVTYLDGKEEQPGCAGIVIEASEQEIYLAGCHFRAEFLPKKGSGEQIGIIRVEEGTFVENEFVPGRILNGDEKYEKVTAATVRDMPSVLHYKIYRY